MTDGSEKLGTVENDSAWWLEQTLALIRAKDEAERELREVVAHLEAAHAAGAGYLTRALEAEVLADRLRRDAREARAEAQRERERWALEYTRAECAERELEALRQDRRAKAGMDGPG